jgi:hypothetical protein
MIDLLAADQYEIARRSSNGGLIGLQSLFAGVSWSQGNPCSMANFRGYESRSSGGSPLSVTNWSSHPSTVVRSRTVGVTVVPRWALPVGGRRTAHSSPVTSSPDLVRDCEGMTK